MGPTSRRCSTFGSEIPDINNKKKDLHHWRSIVNNYYDLEYVYYEGFMYNRDDLTIKPINQTCDFNLFWFLQLFSKPV